MVSVWWSTEPIASSRAPRCGFGRQGSWTTRRMPAGAMAVAGGAAAVTAGKGLRDAEAMASEHFTDVHPSAGRDLAADGRRGAGRLRRVPAAAGVGPAAGRLSDDADPDVLSGGQPGGGDVGDHCAAREAIRTGARPD